MLRKYITSILICLFLVYSAGCTIIGFYFGKTNAYPQKPIENLIPGDQVRLFVNKETEKEGRFVYYNADSIYLAIDSLTWSQTITDTLGFPLNGKNYVEKYNWLHLAGSM